MNNIIVPVALEYYDSNKEKYQNIFRKIKYIKFQHIDSEIGHNKIIFYDKNKNELYSSRYELIGLYYSYTNIWMWSWASPIILKKHTNIIRKVWNYGAELDPKDSFLKTELTTSRFVISNPIQLDIHLSISSYLSKIPMIFEYKTNVEHHTELVETASSITMINNEETKNYITHYMFLLDFDKIEKISKANDNENNNISDI